MSACRTCGAPVRWVVMTKTRKLMPVDRDPSDRGNLVLEHRGRQTWARVEEPLLDAAGPRYLSHFATCPNAAEHRS